MESTSVPAPQPSTTSAFPPLDGSIVAGFLIFFSVLDFLGAGLGILLWFGGNSAENQFGIVLLIGGISGGFVLLAFAKIIQCLHEAAYRLRNIQDMIEKTYASNEKK